MSDAITLTTTAPEVRQIARVLEFPARLAPFVKWESIAQLARDCGAHFDVRTDTDGGLTITLFWTPTPKALRLVTGARA